MENKFKVIIAGGIDFSNYKKLHDEVFSILFDLNMKYSDNLVPDTNQFEIISGHARGADCLGEKFADEHSIKKTNISC